MSIFDEATKKIFIVDLVVDAADVVDVLAVVAVVAVVRGGSAIAEWRGLTADLSLRQIYSRRS